MPQNRKLVGAGVFGSVDAAKELIAGSGGGQGLIWNIGEKAPRNVRFLTDPDGWCGYWEVWLSDVELYSPMTEGMEVPDDSRKTFRVLANVLLRRDDGDRVVPLKLPKDLSLRLTNRMERLGTLTDRDYTLWREGKGFDTKYDYDGGAPEKIDLKQFEKLDLEEVLLTEVALAEAALEAKGAKHVDGDVPVDDDDYDDDEGDVEETDAIEADDEAMEAIAEAESEDGDDEEDFYTEADLRDMTLAELRDLAEVTGVEAFKPGTKKATMVKQIWTAMSGDEG